MVESGDSRAKKKLGETDCSDTGEQKRKAGKAKQQRDTTTSLVKESDLTRKLGVILASEANISEHNKALSNVGQSDHP